MNNGNSASPNKYEEDWDGGTSGFNLIIKNLQPTDVGVDYDCQYSLGSDKHTLTQDATWECKCQYYCIKSTCIRMNLGIFALQFTLIF